MMCHLSLRCASVGTYSGGPPSALPLGKGSVPKVVPTSWGHPYPMPLPSRCEGQPWASAWDNSEGRGWGCGGAGPLEPPCG